MSPIRGETNKKNYPPKMFAAILSFVRVESHVSFDMLKSLGFRTKPKTLKALNPKPKPQFSLNENPKSCNLESLKSKLLKASVFIHPLVRSISYCLDVLFECGRARIWNMFTQTSPPQSERAARFELAFCSPARTR